MPLTLQTKILSGKELPDLENEINEWLRSHRYIILKNLHISYDDDGYPMAVILYETYME